MYKVQVTIVNSYSQQNNGRLFGFSYKQDDLEEIKKISPIPPNMDDGVTVAAGGLTGHGVSLDSGTQQEAESIRKYRCMALHPEVVRASCFFLCFLQLIIS